MRDVKLHSGLAIIEVSTPFLLAEIESDATLQRLVGDRLSDRCVAVQPQAVTEVVARLKALGHMPRVLI